MNTLLDSDEIEMSFSKTYRVYGTEDINEDLPNVRNLINDSLLK